MRAVTSILNAFAERAKRLATYFLFALALIFAMTGGSAQAQNAPSPLPSPTGYVNDYAGVIDQPTKQQIETTLGNLDRQQSIQFAVVTVDTTGGQEIFDYSLAVARGWGIGARDTSKPSLLLLVAIKDRKYFTQVSRHLEGDLPDGLVGQIQREQLVPAFKAGKYGEGISGAIDTFINTLASKQGFKTDTIFPSGTRRTSSRSTNGGPTGASYIVFFVIAIFVIIVISLLGRRGPGGRGGGGWLSWLLLSSLLNSGMRSGSSGWRGGGFGGGDSGSGGGGFGGFGGGGDFGGGGAGGSW
jgi:uncharacterized protein